MRRARVQGADAEQATKQRGKSKVGFGIARLICVKQKETLVLRETSVFVHGKLLGELWNASVRALLCSASTWPLLG